MRTSAPALALFLTSPYYRVADFKMLQFSSDMSATTAVILVFLVLLSLVFRNF